MIADQGKEAKAKARKDILAIAQCVGLTVDQLLNDGLQPKLPKKVAPQYRNPKNNAEQWSGYGRKPRWVAEALDTGSTLDDLKFKSAHSKNKDLQIDAGRINPKATKVRSFRLWCTRSAGFDPGRPFDHNETNLASQERATGSYVQSGHGGLFEPTDKLFLATQQRDA